MYVHVPCAWNAMLLYTLAFIFAIVSLWTHRAKWDAMTTAAVEVGIVLNALLLVQGSIWARATWGVWWDWDVRLTTSLILLLLFAGVLALRSFVHDSGRRATWTAIATIVAFVDVPAGLLLRPLVAKPPSGTVNSGHGRTHDGRAVADQRFRNPVYRHLDDGAAGQIGARQEASGQGSGTGASGSRGRIEP